MRKAVLTVVLAMWAAPAAAQEAPFCAVTAMGAQCHFYSASACWQALQGLDGQCVANTAAAQQPVLPPSQVIVLPPATVQQGDVLGGFLAGQQAGADARARDAQIRYLEPPPKAVSEPVIYVCITNPAKWETIETTVPTPGCIVKPR